MSDKMRWRYGDTNPVIAAVNSSTVVEIGDLLFLDIDNAKPASLQADQATDAANQQLFASKFLGVAMQRSREGDTEPIRVATTGVFEFDCPSTTFELGNFVGPCQNAANNGLANQQAVKVTAANQAIGRVARRESMENTIVLVDIRSKVMCGGVM